MNCSPRIRERPRSSPRHGECQEAASQDRLNLKGLRKWHISPVFVARRISDVKTEYRWTRHRHDRSTDRFGLVLPFRVTVVFDPKPSESAILHPVNQCGTRVTEPLDRTNWAAHLPDGLDLCENIAKVSRHSSFRGRGVKRLILDTMGAQTFFVIWAETYFYLC
jgi:hypothetical protein